MTLLNVLLLPLGSHGDVHPFVGLGVELQRRGHDVTLGTTAPFRDLVRRVGLEFVELGSREEFDAVARNPDVWRRHKAFALLARGIILPAMRRQYDLIADRHLPRRTVVAASTLCFGARTARDKLGVPLATVHLQPAVFWSAHKSPVLSPALLADWVPRWLKQLQFDLAQVLHVDRLLLPQTNAFRAELGLPPARHVHDLWHSPDRVLGMFPEWFAPPQPDWPEQTVLAGFPLWDESTVADVPPQVEKFLDAGDAPIVFTPGSANVLAARFFAEAASACRRLSRRGILLTQYAEQIPAKLPDGVRHFAYVPFSRLLPRAAALVHHGGVGTLAQGLAAGVPQLVMPMSFDQPDNAARLVRLGVAESIRPGKFRSAAVARALQRLTSSAEVKQNCAAAAARLKDADAVTAASDAIEQMADNCPRASRNG